ncbi:MAG: polysaccharide deacetylase family protein [Calditrichia bacterium]
MEMVGHKKLSRIFYPAFVNLIWQLPRKKPVVYLTFDDGPYPPVTREVLRILAGFEARAVFFVSGEQIFQYRHQLGDLDYSHHLIGNHGFYHQPYILKSRKRIRSEIQLTDRLIQKYIKQPSAFFRPPFGMFGKNLHRILSDMKKDLVMWSVMSYDFRWPAEKVLAYLKNNLESGDIIVFHDSPVAGDTLLQVLPPFLEYCQTNNFQFLLFHK